MRRVRRLLLAASCFLCPWFVAAAERPVVVKGVTEAVHDVSLSFSVDGKVARLFFSEGDAVRKGDLLVELESRSEELEVARRKLTVENRADIDAARGRLDSLKAALAGVRKLFETTRLVSKEELEKKELEYLQAEAELSRIQTGKERERLEYDLAVEQLRRRRMTAPFDGQLVEVRGGVGADCRAGEPVARVVDVSQCILVCRIDAGVGYALRSGQMVKLEIDAGGGAVKLAGIVQYVAPVLDRTTGAMTVKVSFENQDQRVKPGGQGRVILIEAAPANPEGGEPRPM